MSDIRGQHGRGWRLSIYLIQRRVHLLSEAAGSRVLEQRGPVFAGVVGADVARVGRDAVEGGTWAVGAERQAHLAGRTR